MTIKVDNAPMMRKVIRMRSDSCCLGQKIPSTVAESIQLTVFSSANSQPVSTRFHGQPATTSTELLPTTDPGGNGLMIHVTSVPTTANAAAFFNGLQQAFPTQSTVAVAVSVDLFVLSGRIFVGKETACALFSIAYQPAESSK